MSYAPASLTGLRDFMHGVTGLSATSLGIVGNAAHTKGYHLGKDRIYDGSGPGIGDQDYSVQTERDRNGLTNAASAIDIGWFTVHGGLRDMSKKLVARCMARTADCRDIREIIYSADGVTVQRYSGIDNAIHTGPGNGDLSHLTHTHVSYYRDSEARAKTPPFAAIFSPPKPKVWYAANIRADIKAAYTPEKVAAKLKAVGVPKFAGYGSAGWGSHSITYSDLEAGLRKRGINFGDSVQLGDVQALMKAGTGA